jgi:hypothetical protein
MKKKETIIKSAVALLLVFAFLKTAAQSDKMNQLVNDRNDLLNQLDEMGVTEKTLKNKKALADYQVLIKKIIDLDAQIIGQANFEIEQREKAKADLQKKLSEKKTGKTVFVTSEVPNDSITDVVSTLQGQTATLDAQLKAKSETVSMLIARNDSIATAYKASLAKQEKLITDAKGMEDKNLLLIFFNSVLLILLLGVLAYAMRKPKKKVAVAKTTQQISPEIPMIEEPVKIKPLVKEIKKEETKVKISSEGIVTPPNDKVDLKLEQIEKLARLREKGYLTDEEFAFQKRQILGGE